MTVFHKLDLLELKSITGHDPGAKQVALHLKTEIDPVPKMCLKYQTMGKAQKPSNANTIIRTL
jgi:hypothetical protein